MKNECRATQTTCENADLLCDIDAGRFYSVCALKGLTGEALLDLVDVPKAFNIYDFECPKGNIDKN
ncbi:MAG: hypothetical protein FWE31_04935 [Firmicutes bacterium]|nr:hypothetical protein [Bacillota bacterium]